MTLLTYVRMVLWSFFGVRRSAAAGEELAKVKPLGLLVTALCLAGTFGLFLWTLVNVAIATLGGRPP